MAITATLLTSGHAGSSDPAVTASVSPTSGSVLFLTVALHLTSGSGSPTFTTSVTGLSGTWTSVSGPHTWGSRRSIQVYRCTNWSGSGTISIDYTGSPGDGAFQGIGYTVTETTGVDTTTPTSNVVSFTTNGTAWNPTLTGASGDDKYFATFSHETDETISYDSTNWTQLAQFGETNGMRRHIAAVSNAADTTPNFSHSTSGGQGGVAFVVEATAGTGATVTASTISLTSSIARG